MQAVERRPGQILERHDMAEESTRQGNLETTYAEAFAQPRDCHNGRLMMMMMSQCLYGAKVFGPILFLICTSTTSPTKPAHPSLC